MDTADRPAMVFLAVYAWQVLDTSAAPARCMALEVVMWAIWAVFVVDDLTRLALARNKAGSFGGTRCSRVGHRANR